MKYVMTLFFLFINLLSFSEGYPYPFKNPYMATIFGSTTLMTEGVSENVPVKEYRIDLPWSKPISEHFWYNKGFKFSLVPQSKKAPLIFLLAGTGSSHNSVRMQYFQRIFYDAGYHVVSISSPMNSNFILNASTSGMPGMIVDDSKDVYNVMKEIDKIIKKEIDISEYYVVGYSLGGSEATFVSYLDESEKVFNFKRVFAINPAVDLYNSAVKIDRFLDFPKEERAKKIGEMIDGIIDTVASNTLPEYNSVDLETVFKIFSQKKVDEVDMKHLIGAAFRLSSMDLNYITDVVNKRGVYVKDTPSKFSPMFENFKKVNFASFEEYIDRIALPYYGELLKRDVTLEGLRKRARLDYIKEYLESSDKIMVVTNEDELILDSSDFAFLKSTFKNLLIYPNGGHCGNMFFTPNVQIMLNFLKNGEVKYEI